MARLTKLVQAMHAQEVRAAGLAPVAERFGGLVASVQIFRNLVVVERGRNDYPSNRGLDLAHPAVQATLRKLQAEDARDPSEGAALVRASMLEVAGHLPEALVAAQEGLAAYPRSVDLLCLALYFANRLSLRAESLAFLDRLVAAAPGEPVFERMREQFGRPQ